jgi:hypothetical protein
MFRVAKVGSHTGPELDFVNKLVSPQLNAFTVEVETYEGISQDTKNKISQNHNTATLDQLTTPLSAIIQKK